MSTANVVSFNGGVNSASRASYDFSVLKILLQGVVIGEQQTRAGYLCECQNMLVVGIVQPLATDSVLRLYYRLVWDSPRPVGQQPLPEKPSEGLAMVQLSEQVATGHNRTAVRPHQPVVEKPPSFRLSAGIENFVADIRIHNGTHLQTD